MGPGKNGTEICKMKMQGLSFKNYVQFQDSHSKQNIVPFRVLGTCTPIKPTLVQTLGSAPLNRMDRPAQPRPLEQRTLGVCPPPTSEGHPGVERWDVGSSCSRRTPWPCQVSSPRILNPGEPGDRVQRQFSQRDQEEYKRKNALQSGIKSNVFLSLFVWWGVLCG